MLISLLKFELRYYSGQLLFRLSAVVFLLLGMLFVQGGFGGDVYKNSPYAITAITSILSLFSIMGSTLFCAAVVLRDSNHKMSELIFSTAITRLQYFAVRFTGLILAVFTLMALAVLGIFTGTALVSSEQLGPVNPLFYIQPLLTFGLPNVLFSGSVIFCTAVLTRNTRAIYASGVLLYILYMVASILGNSPLLATSSLKLNEDDVFAMLADPFGLAPFFGATRTWSVLQRNTEVFDLHGVFLANRALWLSISVVLIGITYSFFKFRLQSGSKKTSQKTTDEKAITVASYRSVKVTTNGWAYNLNTFLSQFKLETISLIRHIPFMVMLLLWIFLYAVELKDTLFSGPYGIHSYPATGIIVQEILSMKFAIILIIFYAAELLGRERADNIHGLVYSTPVRNMALWGAKTLTLVLLVVILITTNIGIGIVLQLTHGYTEPELPLYLSLYYYSGFPLLLFVVLIVFVQSLTSNKYLGMLLNVMVVFVILFGSRLGIKHYLLRYAIVPALQYSYFNGFGHYANAFNWYMLYWSGFAAVLAFCTVAVWQNGLNNTFKSRLRSLIALAKKRAALFFMLMIIWLGSGAYIYYQTNVIGKYLSSDARMARQIQYEKKYGALAAMPQPIIKAIKTQIDLYPNEARYAVSGSYRLKNESGKPISQLWISMNDEVNSFSINIPEAQKQVADSRYNQLFIYLKKPLQPGAELAMNFTMEVNRNGFMPFNNENSVVSNGSYIELEKYIPQFGFNSDLQLSDVAERKKAGLPVLVNSLSTDRDYHLVDMETVVSTAADQYVVTVGGLQKTWTEGDRSFFHYQTAAPTRFMLALSSARYAIKRENYKGLDVELFYHPIQTQNPGYMLQGIKDAMDYGNANFATYPLKQFKLAAIPQYRGAATAYPGVMFNAETINYLGDYSDTNRVNQCYTITAHEVGHQWWANMLTPVFGPGDAALTETLAKYTEAMVAEKRYGKLYLGKYLKQDNNLYFIYRVTGEPELPLAKTNDQPFVHYQKGGLVMYALKEILGEQHINKALQSLLSKHAYPNQKAITADLLHEISAGTTPAQQRFIDDCFNKVITYKMSVKVLSCQQQKDRQYAVKCKVTAEKLLEGIAQTLAPDMDITIAAIDKPEADWNRNTQPIYLQKHYLDKKENVITIISPKKPKLVKIDPYNYLLDADMTAHVAEVK